MGYAWVCRIFEVGWSSSPNWQHMGCWSRLGWQPPSNCTHERSCVHMQSFQLFKGAGQKFKIRYQMRFEKNASAKAKGPGTFSTNLCAGPQVWQAYNPYRPLILHGRWMQKSLDDRGRIKCWAYLYEATSGLALRCVIRGVLALGTWAPVATKYHPRNSWSSKMAPWIASVTHNQPFQRSCPSTNLTTHQPRHFPRVFKLIFIGPTRHVQAEEPEFPEWLAGQASIDSFFLALGHDLNGGEYSAACLEMLSIKDWPRSMNHQRERVQK